VNVQASAGVATFRAGGAASAGVSASEGAFALLRTRAPAPRRPFEPGRLVLEERSVSFSPRRTTFGVGGRLQGGGSSFDADVGATSARITFEDE
jgi:hypothetical protein